MHRFSIFSLFSIIVLMAFNAGAARAEVCSEQLVTYYVGFSASPPGSIDRHISDTSASECESQWTGTLSHSGVPAEIVKETALSGDTALLLREVRNGLVVADQALIKLGRDGRIGDRIHVILASRDFGVTNAYTLTHNGVCTLVILPHSHGLLSETGAMAFIMAHELFHCVQSASIDNYARTDNLWWGEGSAHWFAHMAQPTNVVEFYNQSANIFESDTVDEPLLEFTYSSWPFFAWFAQHRGNAGAVMLLLNGMPEGIHSNADIAGLLSPAEWDEFAKRYSAYQIKVTDRVRVNPRPRANLPHTAIRDEDEATYNFDRRTAKLERYKITLKAGDWELSTTAPGAMYLSEIAASGDPSADWQQISSSSAKLELSVPCDEEKSYALVGFGSNPDDGNFSLKVSKAGDTCDLSCSSLPTERDICVIGIWEDQGPIEQYLSETQTTREATITPIVTLYPDGSYTRDTQLHQVNEAGPVIVTTTLDVSQTLGRWGASGNKLTVCENRQITIGTVHSVGSGLDMTVPLNTDKAIDPERTAKYTYTCNDSTLTLKRKLLGWTPYGENLTFKRQ